MPSLPVPEGLARDGVALRRLRARDPGAFAAAFRDDVALIDKGLEQMVWNVIARLAELAGVAPQRLPAPSLAYASIDGLFQQALLRHLDGDAQAVPDLQRDVAALLRLLLPAVFRPTD